MNRNMDLLRDIVMSVADNESVRVEGCDPATVDYHARLLEEGGLLSGYSQKKMASQFAVDAPRLTWLGHEFLDLSRNQERWQSASQLTAGVGGVSYQVWTETLTRLAREEVEQRLDDND